jgi:hypothetical protein
LADDGLQRFVRAAEARAVRVQAMAQVQIDLLAAAAFDRMWRWLEEHPDASPRDAILAAQVEFGGAYANALSDAFSELLQRSVGTAEVRAMPIGEITLSQRLWRHAQSVSAETTAILRDHAKGVQQVRELALRLYDGYSRSDGIRRPLEGSARRVLPKALRALTDDAVARDELTRLIERGQLQADRLQSQALRAAYSEAFEAWAQGAGRDALQRKLQVAQREKNRHFAERIARTELHRAHQDEVAAELMADAQTAVVQVRMNPRHPVTDICDYHAKADLWGLGPGCYPKSKAPVPPYHPHCLTGDALITASGRITAVSKRWFDGDVVVVATSSGKRLTATVNHPILTPTGWVAAGLLDVGDEVIARPARVSVGGGVLGVDDHQDVPPSIAEIADAFGGARDVAPVEVPGAAEDFHGDGVAGQVTVVWADSQLRDRVDARAAQVAHDAPLQIADMGEAGLLGDSDFHLRLEGLRRATDRSMRSSGHRRALGGGHPPEADPPLLALGAQLDAGFGEPLGDSVAGDTELARQIKDGATGPVFADKVIGIDRHSFSGHVYNLETERGHYTGNGIVTHNCWCRLRSRPDLHVDNARVQPGAAQSFLRDMTSEEAARVVGSRERLARALNGEDPVDIVDQGVAARYRTRRVGQVLAQSTAVPQDAYAVAKAGGTHSGLIKRFGNETEYAIRKSIDSLRDQVALHKSYIADPSVKVDSSIGEAALRRLIELKWPKEIQRFEQEIDVLQGILKERA